MRPQAGDIDGAMRAPEAAPKEDKPVASGREHPTPPHANTRNAFTHMPHMPHTQTHTDTQTHTHRHTHTCTHTHTRTHTHA